MAKAPPLAKRRGSHIWATFCVEGIRVKLENGLVLVSQRLVSSTKASPGHLEVLRACSLESHCVGAEGMEQNTAGA